MPGSLLRKKGHLVYLDHAATTPVDPLVLKAMLPYFNTCYANPSALYKLGVTSHNAIEDSRRIIAEVLHAVPTSIIFCSGGTESDNLAIYGVAREHQVYGRHIISTPIEHSAVLEPLNNLIAEGWEVTFVKADKQGLIDPEDVKVAIRPDTVLVSIMYANNEIGTIEPVAEIGKTILNYRKINHSQYPYFHTDACQAAPYLSLDVEKLHVDLLSLNGSKLYGPKGTGLLYLRKGVVLKPQFYGGGQEDGLRSGTENVTGIVGLAAALKLVQGRALQETKRLIGISVYFWNKLRKIFPNCFLNGPDIGNNRLPNNLNISFKGVDSETLLLYLDRYGIMCSAGSACSTQKLGGSHVLKAVGVSIEQNEGAIRFSLGKSTRRSDVDYVIEILQKIFKILYL